MCPTFSQYLRYTEKRQEETNIPGVFEEQQEGRVAGE